MGYVRNEFAATMLVPVIKAKEKAAVIVIGREKLKYLIRRAQRDDKDIVYILRELLKGVRDTCLGCKVTVTDKYPDVLFTLTKQEYAALDPVVL